MRYLCLVYADEAALRSLPAESSSKLDDDSIAYDQALQQAGQLIVSHALESPAAATVLRSRGGKVVSIDGPFAETKEQLVGFLLIEAKDRDEAIALASKVPMLNHGPIEVRAVNLLEGEQPA